MMKNIICITAKISDAQFLFIHIKIRLQSILFSYVSRDAVIYEHRHHEFPLSWKIGSTSHTSKHRTDESLLKPYFIFAEHRQHNYNENHQRHIKYQNKCSSFVCSTALRVTTSCLETAFGCPVGLR